MLSFKEYCRQLEEKKDAEKRMEDADSKKKRSAKLRKMIAFSNVWRNFS